MRRLPIAATAFTLFFSLLSAASEPSPDFKRVTANSDLGLLRTELAISEYECSSPHSFQLTLYPMIHIGEEEFYAQAQHRLGQHQAVFFESARPPGFFARAFDQVGPFPSASEQDLALLRLRSLRFFLNEFQTKHHRPAASIDEALGRERAYLKNYLADSEGSPLLWKESDNSGLEVCLSQTPTICSRDLPAADPITGILDLLRTGYRLNAEAGGLVAQHDVMSTNHPNFHNADIAYDLIFSQDPSWWDLRNSYAVRVMQSHLNGKNLKKVAIQYGVGHFKEFHKILRAENQCKLAKQEWMPIYRADTGLNLTERQLAKRLELIERDKGDL